MSRGPRDERRPEARFPRVSGDEPLMERRDTMDATFSPRERG